MTDTATAALGVKKALYEAARSLFDPEQVLVSFGLSTERRDLLDVVAFFEVQVRQKEGPMSSTNRARDEDIEQQVVISVTRAGATDDLEVSELAYGYLRTLERHIRMTDPTLGKLAHWCFLTAHESYGYTSADLLQHGRMCEIEATFTARVRITG